jgi:PAS domain S-box-containing protein
MKRSYETKSDKINRQPNTRLTIGVLVDQMGEAYQTTIISGIAEVAHERDANLICFASGSLIPPSGEPKYDRNNFYDLVSPENVDGLIVMSGALGSHAGTEAIQTFCRNYQHLPIVSIALKLEGIPSVLVDNQQGSLKALAHLIEDHGYSRIAFICGPEGNQEANQRYLTYEEALTKYGLPLDPDLVVPGDFTELSGEAAIRLLVDERNTDFRAVVAANDEMALGALEALKKRDILVPDEIAVIGFDDLADSRYVSPPLTTVRQPLHAQGRRAAEMLLAQLDSQEVPADVILPTALAVRQSCGCGQATEEEITVNSTGNGFEAAFGGKRESIVAEIMQAVESSGDIEIDRVQSLFDAFVTALTSGSAGIFLSALVQVADQGGGIAVGQEALSILRRHALSCSGDDGTLWLAKNLLDQAQLSIGEMAQQMQAYQRLQAEKRWRTLGEISEALATVENIDQLKEALIGKLPRLGIERCYLALYQGKAMPVWSRIIPAHDEYEHDELGSVGKLFFSRQLAPNGLLSLKKRFDFIVEPLYFNERQFGFILFQASLREGRVYERLRRQISNTLMRSLLSQQADERNILLAVIDEVPDNIFVKDTLSRIIVDNAAHRRLLGAETMEEVIGKKDSNFFPEKLAWQYYKDEQEIIQSGQPKINWEEPTVDQLGRKRWLLTTKVPLRDGQGNIVRIVGINRDITELKQAQDALKERAAELERSNAELEAIREIGENILASLDLQEIMGRIVRRTVELIGVGTTAAISLYDVQKEALIAREVSGPRRETILVNPHRHGTGGLAWKAYHERIAIVISNASDDLRVQESTRQEGVQSLVILPVVGHKAAVGVLYVDSLANRDLSNWLPMLKILANQAGIAIENAQLFASLSRLHDFSKALATEIEQGNVLQTIVNHAAEVVSADGAALYPYDAVREEFELEKVVAAGIGKEVLLNQKRRPRPNGVAANALDKQMLIVEDTSLSEYEELLGNTSQSLLTKLGIQAFVGRVLRTGDKTVGVLYLNFKKPHKPSSAELEALKVYTDQAAVAIQRAGLFDQLKQEAELIRTIARMTDTIHDETQTCRAILHGAMHLTHAEIGNISLIDEKRGVGSDLVREGFPNNFLIDVFEIGGKSIQGWVAVNKKSALIFDVRSDPDWKDVYFPAAQETLSELTVPILRSGSREIVGIINLESPREHAFSQSDQRLLETLAIHADIAIQNAQSYAKEQSRARELEMLNDIGRKVGQSLQLEIVHETLYTQLQTIFGYDIDLVVMLYDEPNQELRLRSGFQIDVEGQQGRTSIKLEEGICGWVARHKQTLNVPDVNAEPRYLRMRQATQSEVAIPILLGERLVGVLDIESTSPAKFTPDDQHLLEVVANQVAAAIRNAEDYERLKKRQEQLQALHYSAKAVTASLEREQTLQSILAEAARLTGAHIATIQEKRRDGLYFEAVYPPDQKERLINKLGEYMSLDGPGITVGVANTGEWHLENNVLVDPSFVDGTNGMTRSELAVPLFEVNEVRGVLNVEHSNPGAFNRDDVEALITLADLAVVALQNSRRYEELERAKDYLLTSQTVAWLGLLGADWQHTINQKTFSIDSYIAGIHRLLKQGETTPDTIRGVIQAIGGIQKVAQNVRTVEFTSRVSSELSDQVEGQTILDDELRRIIDRWRTGYQGIKPFLDLQCPGAKVKILPQWLRVAMEKLVTNALKAMPAGGKLTVSTRLVGDMAHITIKDTGRGIPDFVRPDFLKRIVPPRMGESGTGMGALIARFVALSHGGDLVLIGSCSGEGTELLLTLPVATN